MTHLPLDVDGLSFASVRDGALRGRTVTVLGFARSGIALARFFADAGARVTVYDARPAGEFEDAIEAIGDRPVRLALGPGVDPASTWADADLVATSPSIHPDYPTTEPRLRSALVELRARRAAGAPVPPIVSEVDLVLRLCPAPTIGVTGTKGKTTTASLIAAVLAADSSHPVVLGGNIGRPLVDLLPGLTAGHRVVIELSELQLPTLSRGTTVAVYTNVTSDHLDRHGSLDAYRAVKRRLAELVDPDGALVLNAADPVVAGYRGVSAARTILYGTDAPRPGGVGVVDGWIVALGVGQLGPAGMERGGMRLAAYGATGMAADEVSPGNAPQRIMPVASIALPGRHSLSNALAAVAVGCLFGIEPAEIAAAVAGFQGVEHRLQPIAEIDGVRFVNDSMGTQPDAVIAAVRAFERPLVLIAGGRDKDVDLSELAGVVADRVDAAVLIGESGPALEALFRAAGLERTEPAASLEAAVDRADAIARDLLGSGPSGGPSSQRPAGLATVLLSPAAASFDMFADYAERGRAFAAAVAALATRRSKERPE